jgi:hypothetical protein
VDRVRRYNRIGSLVLTLGCKFACPYCPIPAYNQGQFRTKSGERIADEMTQLYREYGIRYFFGADDNFFNDHKRALGIMEALARTSVDGTEFRHRFRWGTEVTVHDTLRMKDHMSLARKAGIRALWLGVEDMTGALVKKGQTVDKTCQAFELMQRHGICPMPMMMHHDAQPLWSRGPTPHGLLNQVRLLRKSGAISLQVLMITPATGSKQYEEVYHSGLVYESAAHRPVETHMLDANYVVASRHPKPWRKQFNIMAAYAYFYNPLRFLIAIFIPKSKLYLVDVLIQAIGMRGLGMTVRRTFGWALRLWRGPIRHRSRPPSSPFPMRSVDGGAACHALPGTPTRSHAGAVPETS